MFTAPFNDCVFAGSSLVDFSVETAATSAIATNANAAAIVPHAIDVVPLSSQLFYLAPVRDAQVRAERDAGPLFAPALPFS